MAVSRLNEVWVDNMRLFVKEACFGQDEARLKQKLPRFSVSGKQVLNLEGIPSPKHGEKVSQEKERYGVRWSWGKSGLSFAQVVGGGSSKTGDDKEQSPILKIHPVGNAWLERSVVAILNRVESMKTLKISFNLATDKVAEFRALGGRSVLITFQSKEVRDVLIKGPWMKRWFLEVKPWRGEPASFERFVWLSCFGVPLNAWNPLTFKQIGELWGCFV